MDKLFHSDLIELYKLICNKQKSEGVCRGFSCMWAQAILANDEKVFFERLDLISAYKPDFEALKNEIEEVKKKVQMHEKLDNKAKQLLQILAFFEGIELYLAPDEHSDLFNRNYVAQEDIRDIYSFAKSKKLEQQELISILHKSYAFNKTSLADYLKNLEQILSETDSELPILLDNLRHSVCMKYNKTTKTWFYIDTNDFKRYPSMTSYYREMNLEGLVDSIFDSLDGSSNVVLGTRVLANGNGDLDSIKKSFVKFNLDYPIKPELARMYDRYGGGLLFMACKNGHLDMVKELLLQPGVEINPHRGMTPLSIACYKGHVEVVKTLLAQEGIEINLADDLGATPLFYACQNGHVDVVKELLKQPKTNTRQTNIDTFSPLHIACKKGHVDVVKELLSKNIKINKLTDKQETPLYIACKNGHVDIVKALLKQPGIDVDQENMQYETPLYIACRNGHSGVVRELLSHDPPIKIHRCDESGLTPLHIACAMGHLGVVNEFIKRPKMIFTLETLNTGLTPFHMACKNGHVEVVKALLNNQKVKRNLTKDILITSLYLACESGHLDVVRELLSQKNIDIKQKTKYVGSPLYAACAHGHVSIVKELLRTESIDINQPNNNGSTPFFVACERGHLEVIKELLRKEKIQINQEDNYGRTPFFQACRYKKTAVIKLILKSPRMEIEYLDGKKNSPLQIACSFLDTSKDKKVFELFLNKKASLTHRNNKGQTALDIAIKRNNTVAISMILNYAQHHQINLEEILSYSLWKKALNLSESAPPAVVQYLASYKNDKEDKPSDTKRARASFFRAYVPPKYTPNRYVGGEKLLESEDESESPPEEDPPEDSNNSCPVQ
ncbi:ankyrin repeat domain-containing protein [Legionella sp. WA2022007384]